MKAVLQRVSSASVTVDKQLVSSIGRGILVFAAVGPDDTPKEADSLAAKVLKLKMWPDDSGGTVCAHQEHGRCGRCKMWKKNVQEIQGEVLCVSQFTLLAQIKKGNKPDFRGAADVNKARELYDCFYRKVRGLYTPDRVKNGVFQAMMEVGLVNDGPVGVDYRSDDGAVTLEIETNPPEKHGQDTGSEANSERWKDPKDLNQEEPSNPRDRNQQIEFQLPTSLLD